MRVILLLLIQSPLLVAQTTDALIGARATALGLCTATLQDDHSLLHNPAGIAAPGKTMLSTSFQVFPGMPDGFHKGAAIFTLPMNGWGVGMAMTSTGDAHYHENGALFGLAHLIGNTSLGIRASLYSFQNELTGAQWRPGLTLGGITRLTENVSVGAYISNLNAIYARQAWTASIPVRMSVGLRWHVSRWAGLTELVQESGFKPDLRGGIEWQIRKNAWLRSGFHLLPIRFSLGFGFNGRSLKLHYASEYHTLLNLSHQFTLSIHVGQRPAQKPAK
ncbi:MAG: hypothetical protein U0V64_00500 [Cyclobacteriaceae bacterium]